MSQDRGQPPKIALAGLAACGGCDESFLDLGQELVEVILPRVEIVFWPTAMDAKVARLESVEPGGLAVSLISGGVRTEEMADLARLLRSRSRVLVAMGTCAHMGGIPSLANSATSAELLESVYGPAAPGDRDRLPQGVNPLPPLTETLLPLHEVVRVDHTLPGCPPPVDLISRMFRAFLDPGEQPLAGKVWGSEKALCHECSRLPHKPQDLTLGRLNRAHQVEPEAEDCLLVRGLVCLGPATRGGCGERCISANMPCRGCFGPPGGVEDQAAAILSFLAGHAPVDRGEQAVLRYSESLTDPLGTCNRFGLTRDLLDPRRGRGRRRDA